MARPPLDAGQPTKFSGRWLLVDSHSPITHPDLASLLMPIANAAREFSNTAQRRAGDDDLWRVIPDYRGDAALHPTAYAVGSLGISKDAMSRRGCPRNKEPTT